MNAKNPTEKNSGGIAQLDERDIRALTEYMTVIEGEGPGLYSVTTESGSEYTVDVRHESCMCPDARHRDVVCKHIRRVQYAIGRRDIPDWADTDAIDPRLGEHVDNIVADGGRNVPREDCDKCACESGVGESLSCFEHFELQEE
jgi:hypothetical protein